MNYKKDQLIIITAPSGAGKSTLIRKLINEYPDTTFSVSHTTRPRREGEQDKVDYYFVNVETFKEMIEKDQFLEWAKVHDNYYGTSKEEINTKTSGDKKLILDIDVQGSLNLQQKQIKGTYIFITVPDIEELRKRLLMRNTDSNDIIEKRMKNAEYELSLVEKWENIVVNDNIEKAYSKLKQIIYK